MAIMDLVHVWFRPFRDELSLTRDDGRDAQNGKGTFRRKFGETHLRRLAPHVFASNRLVTSVALGRQTHYTMIQAHLELATRDDLPLVPYKESRASAACTEQVGGEYGLILRGRRRSRLSSTPGQSPTALGRVWRNNEEDNEPALIDHANLDRSRERKP